MPDSRNAISIEVVQIMTTPRNTSLPCSLLFIGLSFSLLALGAIPVAAQRTPPRDPAEPVQGKPQPTRLPRPAGGVARAQVREKWMRGMIRQLAACWARPPFYSLRGS